MKGFVIYCLFCLGIVAIVHLGIQAMSKPKPQHPTVLLPDHLDLITDNPCDQDTLFAQRRGDTVRLEFSYYLKK